MDFPSEGKARDFPASHVLMTRLRLNPTLLPFSQHIPSVSPGQVSQSPFVTQSCWFKLRCLIQNHHPNEIHIHNPHSKFIPMVSEINLNQLNLIKSHYPQGFVKSPGCLKVFLVQPSSASALEQLRRILMRMRSLFNRKPWYLHLFTMKQGALR